MLNKLVNQVVGFKPVTFRTNWFTKLTFCFTLVNIYLHSMKLLVCSTIGSFHSSLQMLDAEISMSSFNYIYLFLKLVWVWYQHLNHLFTSNHKHLLEKIEGFAFNSTFILQQYLTFLLDTWSLHVCNISISDTVINSEFLRTTSLSQ